MDVDNLIEELDAPRFHSLSFFPYSLNTEGEIVMLMRKKQKSKTPDLFIDFGTKF